MANKKSSRKTSKRVTSKKLSRKDKEYRKLMRQMNQFGKPKSGFGTGNDLMNKADKAYFKMNEKLMEIQNNINDFIQKYGIDEKSKQFSKNVKDQSIKLMNKFNELLEKSRRKMIEAKFNIQDRYTKHICDTCEKRSTVLKSHSSPLYNQTHIDMTDPKYLEFVRQKQLFNDDYSDYGGYCESRRAVSSDD